jgi:hypothetical protein
VLSSEGEPAVFLFLGRCRTYNSRSAIRMVCDDTERSTQDDARS